MAPESRYNIALLEQVRAQIENEDKHDQSLWSRISRAALSAIPQRWRPENGFGGEEYIPVSCPTAACVAGWAASLSGVPMLVDALEADYSIGSAEASYVLVDGRLEHISNYARQVLGLTHTEADALFDGEWTNEETLENLDDIIVAAKHGREWAINWHGDDDDREEDY